ncbi:MAG: glycosyltransferase [Proteobacteria bacterium]|nr:glycosyltransferase [Pseudomonadota bacterium]
MIKILNLVSNRWNSAITEYGLSTGRALAVKNQVLNVGIDGSSFLRRATSLGLSTEFLPSFSISNWLKLRVLTQRFQPDLIVAHGGPETILGALSSTPRTPMIRVRGSILDSVGAIGVATHDLGHPKVKLIVAPSNALKVSLEKVSRLPIVKIILGVDESRFRAPQFELSLERPELLIFGRLDPVKGHREFMKIFKRIHVQFSEKLQPVLKIVGLPANLSVRHLEEFTRAEMLTWGRDVVVISDHIEDVPGLLAGASIGVVPSIGSEIICRVAEEFLMCGTPVAVSGVGSLEEVLMAPGFGVSFRDLSEEAAAALIYSSLCQFISELPEVRTARATQAAEVFSLQKMSECWEQAVQRVVL